MRNAVLLISFEVLHLLTLLLLLPSLIILHRLGPVSLNSHKILQFNPQKPVIFKIDRPPSGLNSISFELKNPNLQNHDQITVDILDNNQTVLKSIAFFGSNIGDPSRIDLKFNPITSPSSIYIKLTLKSQTGSPPIFYFADQNDQPVFTTTYKNSSLSKSFRQNFSLQLEKMKKQSPVHLFGLISLIILLNYLILKSHASSRN